MIRIAAFVLLVLLAGCELFDHRSALERSVDEINEKCPVKLDRETRLDRVELRDANTLRYNYTLLNADAAVFDSARFRVAMWPGLLANIRVTSAMKELRDQGVVFEYSYRDRRGEPVYLFAIGPAHYRE